MHGETNIKIKYCYSEPLMWHKKLEQSSINVMITMWWFCNEISLCIYSRVLLYFQFYVCISKKYSCQHLPFKCRSINRMQSELTVNFFEATRCIMQSVLSLSPIHLWITEVTVANWTQSLKKLQPERRVCPTDSLPKHLEVGGVSW